MTSIMQQSWLRLWESRQSSFMRVQPSWTRRLPQIFCRVDILERGL